MNQITVSFSSKQVTITSRDVIMPVCPCNTATGCVVRIFQTRIVCNERKDTNKEAFKDFKTPVIIHNIDNNINCIESNFCKHTERSLEKTLCRHYGQDLLRTLCTTSNIPLFETIKGQIKWLQ